MSPVLGYWKLRGVAQHIRLILHYVGEEYEDKKYKNGPAPDYDGSSWFNEKFNLGLDFPNLPYYKDDKVNISQSMAITKYLARKYNLDGENEEELVRIEMLLFEVGDIKMKFGMTCYAMMEPLESGREKFNEDLPRILESFSKFLGTRMWFAGEKLTYIDFVIYELLDQIQLFTPGCLDKFSNLTALLRKIEALPAIKKYLASPHFIKKPIMGPHAKWGGQDCKDLKAKLK